ncbi:hypothetical protein HG437_002685 [Candidatus Saccharibacteria bacterium]|nr:hypothetical protein [Candidatus Saccharibacteria bacterium]
MATIAAPQHPTLSRRIRASTSVILHERPLGWGESGIMSSDIKDIISVDDNEKESMTKHIAGIIIGIANIVVKVIAITLLWRWFVTPSLGLPEIDGAQACGIMLFIGLVRGTVPSEYTAPSLQRHLITSSAVLMPLFVGWIIHFFM